MLYKQLIILVLLFNQLLSKESANKLVLILTDGFAGHYLHRFRNYPGYRKFIFNGVWSDRLIPEYPSLSIPNFFSVATGLHPADHGVVGNFLYDRKANKKYRTVYNYDNLWSGLKNRSPPVEPIWIAAARQEKNVAAYHWPSCASKVYKENMVCVEHPMVSDERKNPAMDRKNFKMLVPLLASHDFTLLYHNSIDQDGHKDGIYKIVQNQKNNSIANFAYMLQDIVEVADLYGNINVLVVASHGMTTFSRDRFRYLEDWINMDSIEMIVGSAAIKHIIPKFNRSAEIYHNLTRIHPIKNIRLYRTSEWSSTIPPHLHYYKSSHVPELVLVADPGFGIFTKVRGKQFPDYDIAHLQGHGMHGYDNHHPDMQGVLLGYGPDFKSDYKCRGSPRLIDVHALLCRLLKIKCQPSSSKLYRISNILNNTATRKNQFISAGNGRTSFSFLLFVIWLTLT